MIPALALLGACAAPGQDADAARVRLDALIASTNALPGFRAEYVLTADEKELGRIDLAYAGPDRLVMGNSSDKGSARVGIADGALWMTSESPAAGALAGAFELDDHGGTFGDAMAVLNEAFPRPAGQVDVSVRFQWGVNAETDKTEFDLQVAYVRAGEERLLGWLQTLREMPGQLSLEGELLVHLSPRVRAEVDAQTGFLRRLHMLGAEGNEREITLVALDTEGPFEPELFQRPTPAEGARDVSDALRKQMFTPASLRSDCLLQIDRQLRDGRAWDEPTRDATRRFLEALHRPVLVANVERWRVGVLEGIQSFAAELDQRRADGADETELQAVIDERRATLVQSLTDTLTRLREGLASATRNAAPSAHWVDVRSLEDEVLGALFHSEVESPLLQAFDEGT